MKPFSSKQEEIRFLKNVLIRCKELKLYNLIDVFEKRLNKIINDNSSC